MSEKKLLFYNKIGKWCIRITDGGRYQLNQGIIEVIRRMKSLVYDAELREFEFLCCWKPNCKAKFHERVKAHQWIPETASAAVRNRKISATKSIAQQKIILGHWARSDIAQYSRKIVKCCQINFPKRKEYVCVFTGASNHFWGGILKQMNNCMCERWLREETINRWPFWGKSFLFIEKMDYIRKRPMRLYKHLIEWIVIYCGEVPFQIQTDLNNLLYVFELLTSRPKSLQ